MTLQYRRFFKFLSSLCVLSFLFCAAAQGATAEDQGLYPQWQKEYGDRLFEKEKYEDAIAHYAAVLAQNPVDPQAFERLSLSVEKAFVADSVSGNRCRDLLEYIKFLKTRVEFYHSNLSMLRSQIAEFQARRSRLRGQDSAILEDDAAVFELDSAVSTTLFSGSQGKTTTESIPAYEALQNLKKAYLAHIDVLSGQVLQLRKNRSAFESRLQELERQNREAGAGLDVAEIRGELALKDTVIQKQQEQLNTFSGRFDTVLLEMDVLEQKLSATSDEVKRLTQELAGMSLSLYEGESKLADRTAQIHSLEQELTETQERLLLVQKIAGDKDAQILSLEEQVQRLRSDPQTAAEAGFADLRAEVSVLRNRIQDVSLGNQVGLEKLGFKFEQLAKTNLVLRVDNLKKEVKISRLRKSLQDRNLDLARVNDVFIGKDRRIMELNDRLNAYRDKIAELTLLLQRRELEFQRTLQKTRAPDAVGADTLKLFEFMNAEAVYGLSDESVYDRTKQDLSEFMSSNQGSF